MSAVVVPAPCKINLFLEILERRADGFHELVTTMLALDLADELRCEARASGGVVLRLCGEHASADIPTDERNLVVRAASRALEELRRRGAEVPAGIAIELEKRVPSQAGLGGASSDAAAALRAVESLVGVRLDAAFRHELLASLGSDTIFFGEAPAGAALCEGRGERVTPLPAPSDWWVLVVTPELRCPTGAIFASLAPPTERRGVDRSALLQQTGAGVEAARSSSFNRLEEGARAAVPGMDACFALFEEGGLEHVRMSGSGSSFFGLFDSEEAAERARGSVLKLAAERGIALRGCWLARPTELE